MDNGLASRVMTGDDSLKGFAHIFTSELDGVELRWYASDRDVKRLLNSSPVASYAVRPPNVSANQSAM
jgi:hypothetical protein